MILLYECHGWIVFLFTIIRILFPEFYSYNFSSIKLQNIYFSYLRRLRSVDVKRHSLGYKRNKLIIPYSVTGTNLHSLIHLPLCNRQQNLESKTSLKAYESNDLPSNFLRIYNYKKSKNIIITLVI